MFDQHVYVLSSDPSLANTLQKAGLNASNSTTRTDLIGSLPTHPRGVIVVDLQLPGATGYSFLRDSAGPGAMPTIILTNQGDVAGTVEGMRNGAVDVVEKPYDDTNAIARVRAALQKESQDWSQRRRSLSVAHRLSSLTPRESEVFGQLSLGLSNRETGATLDISPRTVEVHRGRIMGKMGARSMTSLVRMVVEAGLGNTLPTLPPVL